MPFSRNSAGYDAGRHRLRQLARFIPLVVLAVLVACTEQLDTSGNCPALCPQPVAALRDTIIEPVVLDTTVSGYPEQGLEPVLLAATGEVETRAIVRFDTLSPTFRHVGTGADSNVTRVDSASLRLALVADTAREAITVQAFDVDTTADVRQVAVIERLLRADRLLGEATIGTGAFPDSLRVPLNGAAVLQRIQRSTRLRVALRLRSATRSEIRILTAAQGRPVQLRYRVSADTTVPAVVTLPQTNEALSTFVPAIESADFVVVVRGAAAPPPGALAVGGLPASRAYLRFEIPRGILDSTGSAIVAATLLLTQRPNPIAAGRRDSVTVLPTPVLAGAVVTDVGRIVDLAAEPGTFNVGTLRVAVADSGRRAFEIVSLVRAWAALSPAVTPRALVLRTDAEGFQAAQVLFFSIEAPSALRPRLRITYVPRSAAGGF